MKIYHLNIQTIKYMASHLSLQSTGYIVSSLKWHLSNDNNKNTTAQDMSQLTNWFTYKHPTPQELHGWSDQILWPNYGDKSSEGQT